MNYSKSDFIIDFYHSSNKANVPVDDHRMHLRGLFSLLEPGHSVDLLDIGCHNGSMTRAIADFAQSEHVIGVDLLVDQLQHASMRNVKGLVVDLNTSDLPFADELFDCIIVCDVIEHVFSPDHLLQEIARLLRPGGYALLTTPNLASWRNRLMLLLGWQPLSSEVSTTYKVGNPRMPAGHPVGHIRLFTPPALRELPQKYLFQVEYLGGLLPISATSDIIGRIAWLLDNLLLTVDTTLADELIIKLRKM